MLMVVVVYCDEVTQYPNLKKRFNFGIRLFFIILPFWKHQKYLRNDQK